MKLVTDEIEQQETTNKTTICEKTMTQDQAEWIALKSITYIFSDDRKSQRFMDLTGFDPDDIQLQVEGASKNGDPSASNRLSEVLCASLDFLMNFEPDLLTFAETEKIAPEDIQKAWICLGGNPEILGL